MDAHYVPFDRYVHIQVQLSTHRDGLSDSKCISGKYYVNANIDQGHEMMAWPGTHRGSHCV